MPAGHYCKVTRELFRIQRGRRNDEPKGIAPLPNEPLQIAQEEVNVQAALMRLIHDDGVVAREHRICLKLGQQNAIGHKLNRNA